MVILRNIVKDIIVEMIDIVVTTIINQVIRTAVAEKIIIIIIDLILTRKAVAIYIRQSQQLSSLSSFEN